MSYPFVVRGDPGDEYIQGTDQLHPLGTMMVHQDGRKFRYAKAGELLVCGEALQGPDEEVEVDLAVAAGSKGDQFISVSALGAEAIDFYKEGTICITLPVTTKVRLYKIKSHGKLAISAGHKIYIVDDAGIQEALVGDEEATLQANPFDGVKTNNGADAAGFAGVACEDLASSAYGWVQTGGVCVALVHTALIEAGPVTPISGQAGKLDVVTAFIDSPVGYVIRGQTSTTVLEASLIFLTVD